MMIGRHRWHGEAEIDWPTTGHESLSAFLDLEKQYGGRPRQHARYLPVLCAREVHGYCRYRSIVFRTE